MASDAEPSSTEHQSASTEHQSAERDAHADHVPGEPPTPEEEAAAERGAEGVSAESKESYQEYLEMATEVEGEGRI